MKQNQGNSNFNYLSNISTSHLYFYSHIVYFVKSQKPHSKKKFQASRENIAVDPNYYLHKKIKSVNFHPINRECGKTASAIKN